jgi:hypothetical protein
MEDLYRTNQTTTKDALKILPVLALTIWVAHFFYFRSFGFYEDDYALVSPAMGWSLSDLFDNAVLVFRAWPQGRPLNFLLPPFFSFIGTQLGGLHVTYLIAFSIVTLNAFLFYVLLKNVSSETAAVIGTLTFCLFPADTTHIFLTHAFHLQTSLTFFLIASLCYLSGRQILPYVIIPGSLLAYESPFMVFLAIPLLKSKWDRVLAKELIRHVAILLGIMLLVVVIRASVGEERVAEMGASISSAVRIPLKIGIALLLGPAVSLALFLYGPVRTLFHWDWQLTIIFVACLVFFMWVLRRLKFDSLEEKCDHQITFRSPILTYAGTAQFPMHYLGTAKLLLAAVLMLCLAYVVSFTHFPPIARYGRETSVHLAAAFGGSLIFGCISSAFVSAANAYRLKNYAVVVLALYLSLLVAYRFSIQFDFKQAWENEREFWTSAIENLPDMTDETVVFVLDHDLPKTRYILTNSYADAIILAQMFQFPGDWKNPPRLFVVHNDWTEHLIREGDHFKWEVPTAALWSHWEVLPNSNVILLEIDHGKLARRFGSINVNGQTLELKPMPPNAKMSWEKRPLYDYLIKFSTVGMTSASSAFPGRERFPFLRPNS